jgi:hypothetical protein
MNTKSEDREGGGTGEGSPGKGLTRTYNNYERKETGIPRRRTTNDEEEGGGGGGDFAKPSHTTKRASHPEEGLLEEGEEEEEIPMRFSRLGIATRNFKAEFKGGGGTVEMRSIQERPEIDPADFESDSLEDDEYYSDEEEEEDDSSPWKLGFRRRTFEEEKEMKSKARASRKDNQKTGFVLRSTSGLASGGGRITSPRSPPTTPTNFSGTFGSPTNEGSATTGRVNLKTSRSVNSPSFQK